MSDFVNHWIDYLASIKRYSPHTINGYRQDLQQFLSFLQQHQGDQIDADALKQLTLKDIRSWLSDRLHRGFSPRSTARAVSSCRSFFKFLMRHQGITVSILEQIDSPRLKQSLPRPLSLDQAAKLVATIEHHALDAWIGLRDCALFTVLYATGMRISEALALKGDIVNAKDHITVVGKGNKMRTIPLIEAAQEAIANYIKACPYPITATTPLFLGARGKTLNAAVAQLALRRYRQSVGLPDFVTPHALRHSCATHLMQESADLRAIQELLGHASLSSTQIYTKVDQRHLMQSFIKAHPRSKSEADR
ncbi:tyrosine recombinase XerC [Candidatus Odyssella thessalonicensis]|uniref:tyrosine recombinase XerC n=1 Tax=Candidatus Odyssella thessalonicensis TaxID=84647 RepID=UPI000225AEFB|nr:tyrosine recombinase XerC [Candidatus Odyssella thessalonicensis]